MSTDERHLGEELDLLIDHRLTPERRSQVEEHLAGCARCRRELDALRSARTAVRDRMLQQEVPDTLPAGVSATLDRVDRDTGLRPRVQRIARPVALGFGLAAAAALVFVLLRPSADGFVVSAADDLAQVRAGALPMDIETTDPLALERHFAESSLAFTTRVFDFGMMGYGLMGGRVHRIAGRPSALFVSRSEDGRYVVCQMYEGRLDELPAAHEERENKGIRFRVYHVGTVTLVFWQEGKVICVLTLDGEEEEAIQLAFAKALGPSRE